MSETSVLHRRADSREDAENPRSSSPAVPGSSVSSPSQDANSSNNINNSSGGNNNHHHPVSHSRMSSIVDVQRDGNEKQQKQQQQQQQEHSVYVRYGSLILLVFQNCSAVLLTRFVQAPHRIKFSIPIVNLVIEVVKFAICSLGVVLSQPQQTQAESSSFPDTSKSNNSNNTENESPSSPQGGRPETPGVPMVPSSPIHFSTHHEPPQTYTGLRGVYESFFQKASWQMAVPAALYTVQNNLLFVALANLDATLFQVVYQLKLLCTAVLMVLMLGRELSRLKWIALFLLFVGIVLTQVKTSSSSSSSGKDDDGSQSAFVGMVAVITCSLCSAFAGVYFEKVLKSQTGPSASLLVRNIQLAVFSFIFNWSVWAWKNMNGGGVAASAGVSSAVTASSSSASQSSLTAASGGGSSGVIASSSSSSSSSFEKASLFQGFDALLWALVLVQAGGGILVAVVIKYADNILKGFATAIAIIVNGAVTFTWFDFVPTHMFMLGAFTVIASTIMYSYLP